jgi:Uma2 family endonuclease
MPPCAADHGRNGATGGIRGKEKTGKETGETLMAMMVLDPYVEEQILALRSGTDGDQYDEVWEGVYIVAPLPNDEHQEIVSAMDSILQEAVGWPKLGKVRAGINLSDRDEGWKQNYREPDVAVFLREGKAINHGTHWQGAADFLVEIISAGERTREKLPFYGSIGVVELLVIDREPWSLELYRQADGKLAKVGQSTLAAPEVLSAQTVGLTFQLLPGEPRPQIKAIHEASGREWVF